MKKVISLIVVLTSLFSMTAFAENDTINSSSVSNDFIDMICNFYDTQAEGYQVLTSSGADITNSFYNENYNNYINNNWLAIRNNIMFNDYAVAMPIEYIEEIPVSRSGDEVKTTFTRNYYDPFVIYGASSGGYDVHIEEFFYEMLCEYTYSNSSMVITSAASRLVTVSGQFEKVGIAFVSSDNLAYDVDYYGKQNVSETATITNDGRYVTFRISFTAIFMEEPTSHFIQKNLSQQTAVSV